MEQEISLTQKTLFITKYASEAVNILGVMCENSQRKYANLGRRKFGMSTRGISPLEYLHISREIWYLKQKLYHFSEIWNLEWIFHVIRRKTWESQVPITEETKAFHCPGPWITSLELFYFGWKEVGPIIGLLLVWD